MLSAQTSNFAQREVPDFLHTSAKVLQHCYAIMELKSWKTKMELPILSFNYTVNESSNFQSDLGLSY